ncbi:MAG TPA: hypothetical protein VN616_02410 [Puia sp.]|nr:hypothetical protein [Puia sp.]
MKEIISGGPSASAHKIHLALRVASAMCFIGHGTFGILTKPIWCNYFAVFGIGHDAAYHLMPYVGAVDLLMGVSLLVYPTRAILGWLVIWGATTAMLRPLSGEPVAELIERAGNFGAPLALLLLSGAGGWWTRLSARPAGEGEFAGVVANEAAIARVIACLRVVVFLLFLGHGWLNWIEKKSLLDQYAALGFSDPGATARLVGFVEMSAALSVLIRPLRPLILTLFLWKMCTELLYPHHELFEWIERGGSYGCLLALWLALETRKHQTITKNQILAAL